MNDNTLILINVGITIGTIGLCFLLYYFLGYKKFKKSMETDYETINDNLKKIEKQLKDNNDKITTVETKIKDNKSQIEQLSKLDESDDEAVETFISTREMKGCSEKQRLCEDNISIYNNPKADFESFSKYGKVKPFKKQKKL